MQVIVRELVGGIAITLEDGQKVYDLIHPALVTDQDVDLDFAGVTIIASPFFNAAIGQLLQDIQPDALNRLLHFFNLTPAGAYTLRRVIENAKRYYADAHVREAVDHALEEYREEAEAR